MRNLNIVLITIVIKLICNKQCDTIDPFSSTVALGAAFISSAGLSVFTFFRCRVIECCDRRWIKHDIDHTVLQKIMKERIYGQDLAIRSVIKHIKSHLLTDEPSKALALSLHGSTGTGKNFISKIVAEYIFKKGLNSAFVHLISSVRDFPHSEKEFVNDYKVKLKNFIEEKISQCDRSLFIFDEMDKMPGGLSDIIKPYLEYYDHLDNVVYRRAMFFFLSNSGGSAITNFALENFRAGKSREAITLKDLERTVSLEALNFNSEAGFWNSDLIKDSVITAFVPLLPLERGHVRSCIVDYMTVKKHRVTPERVDEILNLLDFYPRHKEERYSTTGCKRVAEKVDFIMTDFF